MNLPILSWTDVPGAWGSLDVDVGEEEGTGHWTSNWTGTGASDICTAHWVNPNS